MPWPMNSVQESWIRIVLRVGFRLKFARDYSIFPADNFHSQICRECTILPVKLSVL
jgi:hypothetical protein